MAGLIVQLIISWIVVWLYERNNLKVLGLLPSRQRIQDLALFLLVTSICCASGFLLKMYFGGIRWEVNPNLSPDLVMNGILWHIRSVLFEELIFRGVLLYILIQKLGIIKAMLISSVTFGIYHWFSFNIFGDLLPMIIVFFITGVMGMIYAFGYTRTMSLYIPIAIHFGWNFTQGFVFSDGATGTGMLKQVNDQPFQTDSYLVASVVFLLPMLSVIIIDFLLIKRKAQVDPGIYKPKRMQTGPHVT